MRVVVLTTSERYTPGVRLLSALAAGLASRGDTTTLACLSRGDVERAVEQEWPRLSFRAIVGTGFVRRLASVRGIFTALRPDAVLVASDDDASLAAVAMGPRGGVVRRLSVRETATARREGGRETNPASSWRSRVARSRTRYDGWGTGALAVSWPSPETAAAGTDVADTDASVYALTVPAMHLVIVPSATHDTATALALRAASHLRARLPALQVTLLGEPAALQGTRLHAASLDLTRAVQILPLDALLHYAPLAALAVWICADDDAGAVATLAAMQQRIPTVVPADASFAEIVAPGITGFLAAPDAIAVVTAELARLVGDPTVARRMGDAAAARAAREYGWDAFVDDAADRLARVSGTTAARITSRPRLTPA